MDFNLNNYVLVQITEYGWDHLNKTVGESYIKNCIEPYRQQINNEHWWKLQGHQMIELFGGAIFISSQFPIKSNIKLLA